LPLVLSVLALALLGAGGGGRRTSKAAWTDAHYLRFTPERFSKYKHAKKQIDLENVDYALLDAAIFFETSRERVRNKQGPCVYSSALRRAAAGHCKDMIDKGFLSHENPHDARKRTPRDRIRLAGGGRARCAENLGVMVADEQMTYLSFAEALVAGWMRSPGHRANILDPRMAVMGCAARIYVGNAKDAKSGAKKVYAVKACQNFSSGGGRPDRPGPPGVSRPGLPGPPPPPGGTGPPGR